MLEKEVPVKVVDDDPVNEFSVLVEDSDDDSTLFLCEKVIVAADDDEQLVPLSLSCDNFD